VSLEVRFSLLVIGELEWLLVLLEEAVRLAEAPQSRRTATRALDARWVAGEIENITENPKAFVEHAGGRANKSSLAHPAFGTQLTS
jgi:hypothetical protein